MMVAETASRLKVDWTDSGVLKSYTRAWVIGFLRQRLLNSSTVTWPEVRSGAARVYGMLIRCYWRRASEVPTSTKHLSMRRCHRRSCPPAPRARYPQAAHAVILGHRAGGENSLARRQSPLIDRFLPSSVDKPVRDLSAASLAASVCAPQHSVWTESRMWGKKNVGHQSNLELPKADV